MELIKDKYDDLNNRIRPGSVFVGTRTDNLKFIDKDGAEAELVPLSRYFAKETILRGQPVSIAQLSDLTKEEAADRYAYVKVTDPDVDASCIGLALNYAEAGQIVQIQRYGTFSFLTTKSKKYEEQTAEKAILKEVFIDANAGFLFDKVRGQKLYLKKVSSVYNNDHDSKNKDKVNEANVSSITYDYMDSVYTAKNTIQIGQLADAPTVGDEEDQVVTIELDVTGDTRGPIDHTQFIVTLGEDIEFQSVDKDQTLTEPYNDEGIFNEIKVLALADRDPEKALFSIVPKTAVPNTVNTKAPLAFIGVRKLGGKSVIIPLSKMEIKNKDGEVTEVRARTFDEICNVQTNDNDIGYLKLLKSKYNSDQSDPVIMDPVDLSQTTVKNYAGALKDAILKALETLDSDAFTGSSAILETKTIGEDQAVEEWQIEAAKAKGYFDLYESSELVRFFNIKTLKHGTEAPKGTAILADIRDANRCNVIGVVVDNFNKVHKAGSTVKVMRAGRFLTTGNMKVGAEYFLGLNGRITTKSQYWYDTNVKIGTTETAHNLIVNVQEIQHDFSGSLEMGFVKSCAGLVPEKGYVLMDGVTRLEKVAYKDFYEYLLGTYSASELYAYELDDNGNTKDTIDDRYFIVPRVVMDDGKTVCQIKYLPNGIYHNLPRAPFLRFYGNIDENNKVESRDITRLVHYGTLEQSRIAPTLENIDVRLFVREPGNKLFPIEGASDAYADKYIWREMQPGFHVYNNDTVYGFDWVVKQDDYKGTDGLYVLEIETNQGLGICKINAQGQPIPLKNAEYKLIVTAKNLWTREYSLLDTSDVADSMELNTDDIAPSVNTIREYYEKKVATKELNVADGQLVSNEKGTTIKNLVINKTTFVDEKGKSLKDRDEDFTSHVNQTATHSYVDEDGKTVVDGVHGLINLGAQGNLNSKFLAGLQLSDGKNNLTEDADTKCWIPFVKVDQSSNYTAFNSATATAGHMSNGATLYEDSFTYASSTSNNSKVDSVLETLSLNAFADTTAITSFTKNIVFGDNEVKTTMSNDGEDLLIKLSDGSKNVKVKGIDDLTVGGLTVSGVTFDDNILTHLKEITSSIAFKTVYSEKINPDVKAHLDSVLTPNVAKDANGNPTEKLDTSKLPTDLQFSEKKGDEVAITKFGSALQALYEMPLSVFDYNYGGLEFKKQLGILIERINQVRNNIVSGKAGFVHKVSKLVQSEDTYDKAEGVSTVYDDKASARVAANSYTYTEDEAKSISNYLNLITNKAELAQELRSTVTILMAAAQETQERLLNVESSVFGFDAETIPGKARDLSGNIKNDDKTEQAKLQKAINNSPLLLGLNRLMRAVCLELYDTTDLEEINSETDKILEDSDALRNKVTVKSRIDEVDTILTDLMYRYNGLVRMEMTSINRGETHNTWEPLVNGEEEVESEEKSEKAYDKASNKDNDVDPIEITASDTHSRTGQVDKSTTWKTLPSADDVTDNAKSEVGFAEVFDGASKHSPTKDDCGIVRVPATETVEMEDQNSGTGKITVTKIKYDAKTGLPIYKEKGVAFLDSKVERMNLKLSEITKTIYGTDDVTAKYPNRTEVLRRNISNLIDDLYPNRTFNAENEQENGLYTPFTESTGDGGSKTIDQKAVNPYKDQDAVGPSIIKPIVDTLYNFVSTSTFMKPANAADGKGILSHNNAGVYQKYPSEILWDAYGLSTTAGDADKDFSEKTLSQLDWIKSVIGIQNTIASGVLYDKDVYTLLLNTDQLQKYYAQKAISTEASDWQGAYVNELEYKYLKDVGNVEGATNGKKWETAKPVASIANGTMTEALVSRKEKSLESRLTTVEAALDDFANFSEEVEKISNESEGQKSDFANYVENEDRFEETNLNESMKTLVASMVYGKNEMFTFDKAFFDKGMAFDNETVWKHNKHIIDEIDKKLRVLSRSQGDANCDYTLTCEKTRADAFTTDLTAVAGKYTITVVHVASVPSTLESNTIYLKGEVISDPSVEWSHKDKTLSGIDNADIDTDLTVKNMFYQMKAMAKDLAQNMFNHDHPVGTIFTRTIPADGKVNWDAPDFGKDPYGIDIGDWVLQETSLMSASGSAEDTDQTLNIVNAKETDFTYDGDVNVVLTHSQVFTADIPEFNTQDIYSKGITIPSDGYTVPSGATVKEENESSQTHTYTIAEGTLLKTGESITVTEVTTQSGGEASSSENTYTIETVGENDDGSLTFSGNKTTDGSTVLTFQGTVAAGEWTPVTTVYGKWKVSQPTLDAVTFSVKFTANKLDKGVVEDPLYFKNLEAQVKTSTAKVSSCKLQGTLDVTKDESALVSQVAPKLAFVDWYTKPGSDGVVYTGSTSELTKVEPSTYDDLKVTWKDAKGSSVVEPIFSTISEDITSVEVNGTYTVASGKTTFTIKDVSDIGDLDADVEVELTQNKITLPYLKQYPLKRYQVWKRTSLNKSSK